MKIYTSYFANLKNLDSDLFPIAIVRKFPQYAQIIPNYQKLAPTSKMLTISQDEYEYCFDKILKSLDAETVIKELAEISSGKDVVLVCYEKNGSFCHRHLVADWLSNAINQDICEIEKKTLLRNEVLSLF
jgi:hypothetical protein